MFRCRPWRAVASLACGHAVSMALVAAALALRLPLDRTALQWGAGALLLVALACYRRKRQALAAHSGMALWSFIMATAHGTGMMLLPALMPACGGSVVLLAVSAVHAVAMLAANGALAFLAILAWRVLALKA